MAIASATFIVYSTYIQTILHITVLQTADSCRTRGGQPRLQPRLILKNQSTIFFQSQVFLTELKWKIIIKLMITIFSPDSLEIMVLPNRMLQGQSPERSLQRQSCSYYIQFLNFSTMLQQQSLEMSLQRQSCSYFIPFLNFSMFGPRKLINHELDPHHRHFCSLQFWPLTRNATSLMNCHSASTSLGTDFQTELPSRIYNLFLFFTYNLPVSCIQ